MPLQAVRVHAVTGSGADLSWLVGLAVTTPVYYLWARNRGEAAPAPGRRDAPREPAATA
ncbi:hypothetical protein ABZV67_03455 [Streptomyces sp. NPDC005065]|uniref:hypothetical protein n=1 Tax=unclassified Streptomyces TaxID=2593676 RepID=UPI0033AFA515